MRQRLTVSFCFLLRENFKSFLVNLLLVSVKINATQQKVFR